MGREDLPLSPWTQPNENSALETLEGSMVWGYWELKRKFPVKWKFRLKLSRGAASQVTV